MTREEKISSPNRRAMLMPMRPAAGAMGMDFGPLD